MELFDIEMEAYPQRYTGFFEFIIVVLLLMKDIISVDICFVIVCRCSLNLRVFAPLRTTDIIFRILGR